MLIGDNPFAFADAGGAGAVWIRTRPDSPGTITVQATHPSLGERGRACPGPGRVSPVNSRVRPSPSIARHSWIILECSDRSSSDRQGEGDIDVARALVASTEQAELFIYHGDQHLFADASLPGYDRDATALLIQRVLSFLRER